MGEDWSSVKYQVSFLKTGYEGNILMNSSQLFVFNEFLHIFILYQSILF